MNDRDEAELQRKVWNYGAIPLMFVIRHDRIDIINALCRPELKPDGTPAKATVVDKLKLAAHISGNLEQKNEDVARRYSARAFANGTFWDDPRNRNLLCESTAQKCLLDEMRRARAEIDRRGTLPEAISRRFFIICLMVKFLEDRNILRESYFSEFHTGCKQFSDLLRLSEDAHSSLRSCLKHLAKRFNGDVFHISLGDERKLSSADLSPYADFVDGNLEGTQRHLWRLYSFEHLPVELISYIYEDFLRDNKEAVYTPHMLVDLLLDELLSARTIGVDYRILDPACGSGVFLVGAFRRLVEGIQAQRQGNAGQLSVKELVGLLENNIHGIDIDPIAVELTAFGLCVALCSEMSTEEEVREMRFPTLVGRSIRSENFFSLATASHSESDGYDLIIGNPPFGSEVAPGIEMTVASNCSGERCEFPALPDRQLCYLFLREAPKLLKPGGVGCLLQKDGFLYNAGVLDFRAAFLANYEVPQIFDFVSVRGLFSGRKSRALADAADGQSGKKLGKRRKGLPESQTVDTKAVAVFFRRVPSGEEIVEKPILHATFRKLLSVWGRIGFELDAYDYHWVTRAVAMREPCVWKANLLGGGRLLGTYRAFVNDSQRTIGKFLRQEMQGWVCSEGYAVGDKGAQPQPKLTGLLCLDRTATKGGTVDWAATSNVKEERFKSSGDLRIYSPPHLIVWKHESLETCTRSVGAPLAFTKRFVGIAAPQADAEKLRALGAYLQNSRRELLFFAAFGHELLVNRTNSVLKEDIMKLPYPEGGKLVFRGIEQALCVDVLDLQLDFVRRGAHPDSPLFRQVSDDQVAAYTETFERVLKNTFPQVKFSHRYNLPNALCISFVFGDSPAVDFGEPSALEQHLDSLLTKQKSATLRVQRVVRVFDENCLFFVKPRVYRFWTRSIAVRDADETFAFLRGQGL